MAETIINSNQVRASGDTSSQTLLNENQIRQAGDTSSETLINPNQIAGGGTLNATVVGNPTISNDFIVSDLDNNNYLSFNLVNPNKKAWEICFKFKLSGIPVSGRNSNIIISSPSDQSAQIGLIVYVDHINYSTPTLRMNVQTDPVGTWGGYTVFNFTNIQYTVANEWWWMKVGWTGAQYYMSKSLDGENFNTEAFSNSYNQTVFTQDIENIGASGLISQGTNLVIVDMKEFEQTIEGVIVWQGVI